MQYSLKKNFIIGLLLGFSVMIPGLGPSTVMIYSNTYNDIINAISNLKSDFKKNFKFLLPIVFFALIGFILGLLLIKFLFNKAPLYWIFFFGGILIASLPGVIGEKKIQNKLSTYISILIGIIVPVGLYLLNKYVLNFGSLTYSFVDYIKLLGVGVLIALTQLIPGLSATILLLSLGLFDTLLDGISLSTLTNFKLMMVYFIMIVGAIIGVILFTKLVSTLLKKQEDNMHCVTIGLSFASVFLLLFGNEKIDYVKTSQTEIIIACAIMAVTIFAVMFSKFIIKIRKNKQKETE